MKVYGCYTNTTSEFTRSPLEEMARSVKCSGGGVMEELENIGCVKAGEMCGGKYDKYLEEHRRVYSSDGTSPTVHTAGGGGRQLKILDSDLPNVRIRMLTEKECFRLMGVKDEDYAKIAPNQSKTSRVHLAGDSIATTCMMAIFGEMFENVDYRQKIQEVVESVKEDKNERD